MDENPSPVTPEGWATLLKANWEKRGRSDSRDFYVASHLGWNDTEAWQRQAKIDTEILLYELTDDWLSSAEVLEIGCGVGRLAPWLLERAASYTGLDIASAMVEEARQRVQEGERARFFVSDGLGVPDPARDREYDLIVAMAVFIHCPRDLVERLVRDATSLLRKGGRLRFQLLADASDPTGVTAPAEAAAEQNEALAVQGKEVAMSEDMELITDHYYMGHAFGFDEARELFETMDGELRLLRFDLGHIYGEIVKT